MKYEIYYYDKSGRRYEGRKRKCADCGKEETIRSNNKALYCKVCCQRHTKKSIKHNEHYIVKKSGERNRANMHKCSMCGKEWLARADTILKSSLCKTCTLSENGKKTGARSAEWNTKNGTNLYRRRAFELFKQECVFCKSPEKTQVHHLDCDRQNNNYDNLIPLCNSCHKSVHWRIRKGLSPQEAFKHVKERKTLKA